MLYLFPKPKRNKSSVANTIISTTGKERYYDQFTSDMKNESLINFKSMRTDRNEDVILGDEDESKRINADVLNNLIEIEK